MKHLLLTTIAAVVLVGWVLFSLALHLHQQVIFPNNDHESTLNSLHRIWQHDFRPICIALVTPTKYDISSLKDHLS